MDPASHFLVAFLPLVAYSAVRYRRLPSGLAVLALLFATQLPDLIDKPLAWMFGVFPSGRMLAHSLVVAVPIVLVLAVIAHRRGYGAFGNVFAFGYLLHLLGDYYPALLHGTDYYYYPNMFWPLMEANPDPYLSFAANMPEPGMTMLLTVGLVALVCLYGLLDVYRRRPALREADVP